MKPYSMTAVIGGKRYQTDTATLIASDAYWDGHNWERKGRNSYLYRTPRGAYFLLRLTSWQGERSTIVPISADEAVEWWEHLPEHDVEFEAAFPGVAIEEA